MSFRIVDILKTQNKCENEEKYRKRSTHENLSAAKRSSSITRFHNDFDGIGALMPYTLLHRKEEKKHLKSKYKHRDVHKFKTQNVNKDEKTSPSTVEIPSSYDSLVPTTTLTSTKLTTPNKKRRILFTRDQTYELQKVFQCQQYLTVPQRDYLSRKINLSPTQVKIWFQNHRYKLKKYMKECTVKSPKSKQQFHTSQLSSELANEFTIPYNSRSSLYVTEHTLFPRLCESGCSVPLKSPPHSPLLYCPKKYFIPSRSCSYPEDECSYFEKDRQVKKCLHISSLYHSEGGSATLCDCDRYRSSTLSSSKRCCSSESYGKLGSKE